MTDEEIVAIIRELPIGCVLGRELWPGDPGRPREVYWKVHISYRIVPQGLLIVEGTLEDVLERTKETLEEHGIWPTR